MNEQSSLPADRNVGYLRYPVPGTRFAVSITFPYGSTERELTKLSEIMVAMSAICQPLPPGPEKEPWPTPGTIIKTPARPDGIKVEYHVQSIGKATDPFPNLNASLSASLSKRDAEFALLPTILRDVYTNVAKDTIGLGSAWPVPVKAIADRLGGVSQSYIRLCIAKLCKAGWLRRTGRGKLEVAR